MNKPLLISALSLLALVSCGIAPTSSGTSSSNSDKSTSQSNSDTSKTSSKSSTSKTSLPEIDHIKVFCDASYVNVWAWTGSNNNLFEKWPGVKLNNYDSDWKTYDFPADYSSLNLIFSKENGTEQTRDLTITAKGYWWFYKNDWYQENPLDQEEESSSSSESSDPSSSSLSPITPVNPNLPDKYRTWYQLLVYSFADSNNDGIGDFKGIVEHLDYLSSLGIGGIWLSPVNKAGSYHGYDVTNYYEIEDKYTVGNVTLEKLVTECHKYNIKVIMDMVFNHTSSNHPWTWEHRDWYTGEHLFDGSMPDLNYDNQEVRAEIKKVGRYWLDKGVDGFRLDAAAWIYGGNGWKIDSTNYTKTKNWWKEFADDMYSHKAGTYLIGEVYTDLQYSEEFYETGIEAFTFSGNAWAKEAIERKNGERLSKELATHQQKVRERNPNGIEANFISNHDTGRYAMSPGGNKEQLMFANAYNALAPGDSYIYYGDELGLKGSGGQWEDHRYRTPMPFNSGKTNGNNYCGQNLSSSTLSGKTADGDKNDSSSLYNHLAKAIKYKNEHLGLYNGTASIYNTSNSAVGGLKMDGEEGDYLIVFNASDTEQTITLEEGAKLGIDLSTNGQVSLDGTSLTIPKLSIAVFEL